MPCVRACIAGAGVNRFRVRNGDFTEERFGVEQRSLLASLRDEPGECIRYFDWFGSYLIERTLEGPKLLEAAAESPLVDSKGRVTYVEHVDARGAVPPSERRAGATRKAAKRRASDWL